MILISTACISIDTGNLRQPCALEVASWEQPGILLGII
jgi:hypothetical protein